MIAMAQQPQQQASEQQQARHKAAQLAHSAETDNRRNKSATAHGTSQPPPPPSEQDGRRTLIKNQLYLIEQLQLENANLRNERDQLQLENEELKFQLQMIRSSNILSQPGATFNDRQLEKLVEGGDKGAQTAARPAPNSSAHLSRPTKGADESCSAAPAATTHSRADVTITAAADTTERQRAAFDNSNWAAPVTANGDSRPVTPTGQPTPPREGPEQEAAGDGSKRSGRREARARPQVAPDFRRIARALQRAAKGNRLADYEVGEPPSIDFDALLRDDHLLGDDSDKLQETDEEDDLGEIILLTQFYGPKQRVQQSAIIVQRAFRKYQICKRFRTITDQLRHACQPASQRDSSSARSAASSSSSKSVASDAQYVAGATRVAAWESLAQAASRLAASAAAATSSAKHSRPSSGQQPTAGPSLGATPPETPINLPKVSASQRQTSGNQRLSRQAAGEAATGRNVAKQQDPVVAAAINFQQLESIRKRQYRVGLNIFNKSPEKGVSFLIAHSFIDSSSPYAKTSTGYYQSNQMHLIDEHLMQNSKQQQQTAAKQQACQLCYEEENLKRNVAHFLLHRKGLAKEKIGQYLGNLQEQFNQDVLRYYLQELDFHGLQIDLALRKFSTTFRLPGEAQKIERIVDCFAQRYAQCQQQSSTNVANIAQIQLNLTNLTNQQQQQQQSNCQPSSALVQSKHQLANQQQAKSQGASNYKNNLMLLSKDEIFILTFAIIMLNTDLHSPSLKPTSRMSAIQFVNNLRGVFKSQTINETDLVEIYERVKANQITTAPDHVNHVMKVQQGLTVTNFQKKELPNLCVPHRRLVCFCRLFEVYDVNKKERAGQHQREIFLFNDLLLVTKLARRVRANSTQLYAYRQSIPLQGLHVQLFQSAYYIFGIRLCRISDDETVIMFNARNELDQSRFVDDLNESIAEMDEMATIKANNLIDTIHFKYVERLKQHASLHNTSRAVKGPPADAAGNFKTIGKCDTMDTNDHKALLSADPIEHQAEDISGRSNSRVELMSKVTNSSSPSSSQGRRVRSKFNSMSNLSSVAENRNDSDDSPVQPSGLRPNRSFALQQPDRELTDSDISHRRCSATSVYSLDSGLFLSRDASPNQSS